MASGKHQGKEKHQKSGWLTGQLLIAMPSMMDPRFSRTVIYLCSHGLDGAMGLVLNRLYGDLSFAGLLKQFDIKLAPGIPERPIHFGGPVEPARGFVLHSSEFEREGTTRISDTVALTATIEILKALGEGNGPEKAMLALGYAGWGAGQLDNELQDTGWLVAPPDDDILFGSDHEGKWERALTKIGVSATMLSGDVGHA